MASFNEELTLQASCNRVQLQMVTQSTHQFEGLLRLTGSESALFTNSASE